MEFSEEKATEIISRFGLDEKTLKVWRTRGAIPEKYFREGFEIKEKAKGERNEQLVRDVMRILSFKKINMASIFRLAGIEEIRYFQGYHSDQRRTPVA